MQPDINTHPVLGSVVLILIGLGWAYVHYFKDRYDFSHLNRKLEAEKLRLEIIKLRRELGIEMDEVPIVSTPARDLSVITGRDRIWLNIVGVFSAMTPFLISELPTYLRNSHLGDGQRDFVIHCGATIICSILGWHLAVFLSDYIKQKVLIYIILLMLFSSIRWQFVGLIEPFIGYW